MKKEYVLMLGAGLMQGPAIAAIRELGLSSVVIDANPEAPCANEGDEFRRVDLKDKDAIVSLAAELNEKGILRGVFTAGTDFSANVAAAAKSQGLAGHDYEACVCASNKVAMRSKFKAAGVPSPEFCSTSERNLDEARKFALESGFPLVVKPVDNMGARGCRMIRSESEFDSALRDAIKFSRSGTAIIEQYMDGPEFSIDSVVYDGTLTITGFADRHIYYPPYFIETGHTMSTAISEKDRLALIKCFAAGIRALGLSCGAAKADIKLTSKGPMIGEIAARLSGGYMSGWTFPYASGCKLTKELLKVAIGSEPDVILKNRIKIPGGEGAAFELYEYPCGNFSAERAWLSIPGRIASVYGMDEAKSESGIKDVLARSREGDSVRFPRNNVEKCGNVISRLSSREQAVAASESAVAAITLRLEPENPETDEFMAKFAFEREENFPPDAYEFSKDEIGRILSLCGNVSIPADAPLSGFFAEKIPPELKEMLFSQEKCDWNHVPLSLALEKFDSICGEHGEFSLRDAARSLIRGGVQGLLYLADCAAA